MTSSQFFIALIAFLTTAFSASAQETNTRSAEMSRTAKSSENSATTTASELQLNIHRPTEQAKSAAQINKLLTLVRTALLVESNKLRYHENLEQPIRMKSEQDCPSIGLMDLIEGSTPFTVSPETGKQELRHAADILTILFNELSTK